MLYLLTKVTSSLLKKCKSDFALENFCSTDKPILHCNSNNRVRRSIVRIGVFSTEELRSCPILLVFTSTFGKLIVVSLDHSVIKTILSCQNLSHRLRVFSYFSKGQWRAKRARARRSPPARRHAARYESTRHAKFARARSSRSTIP